MSDAPQGPGWWQASDDKWYPPPRPEMPGEEGGGYPAAPPTAPVGFGPPPGAQPSPDGGMPAAPGGQGPNRTPLFITIGVIAAAALVVVLVVTLGGGDDDNPEETGSSSSTTQPEEDTTTTEGGGGEPSGGGGEPPDSFDEEESPPTNGGDLEVSDSNYGFQMYEDETFGNVVTYGLIIDNTSDRVARSTTLRVSFLDSAGTVLTTEEDYVQVIPPEETFGYGADNVEVSGEATEMQVEVTVGLWVDPGEYGSLSASEVETGEEEYGGTTVTFNVESTYSYDLDNARPHAIFYDDSGKIVGGASGYGLILRPDTNSVGEISAITTIPGIDKGATEVWVDAGFY